MNDTEHLGRRDVLRAVGTTALVGGTAGTAGAIGGTEQAGREPAIGFAGREPAIDFAEWFADVDNFEGVEDATGQSTVRVRVGADGNNGAFAFAPPAVRVDPGTTVVWEWTGDGGSHDVAAEDGAYASPLHNDAGATFEHTFDAEGISYYACTPHEALGMKGAIVVGDVIVGSGGSSFPEPDYGDWFDGVPNFDGTVDAAGMNEVRIEVGRSGGDGPFTFEPAAVRVDPGTTVVWEVTAGGESHTITARDGSFTSGPLDDAGSAFALTFRGDGISPYRCTTHENMRGAIVVGGGGTEVTTFSPLGTLLGGGFTALALGVLGYGVYLHARETMDHGAVVEDNAAERRRNRNKRGT